MRPAPVLLYLMQPTAQQRPPAHTKAARVHAERRAHRGDGAFAPARRLRQLASHLLPA